MSGFYKMDPAAWDFGTADLSLEEEAAYLRIVNAIHKHDSPVPDNERVLAGLFRSSTRKARSLIEALVAAGKLTIEDGQIWNGRARVDLQKRGFTSAARADAGAKGGRARAANAGASPEKSHNSQPVRDQFTTNSTIEPTTNPPRTGDELELNLLNNNGTHQASASSRIEKNRIEDSVASATDGEAVDFAKTLFDRAVAFLGRHGTPESQARSFLGKLRKTHPDAEIFDAFTACGKAGAVDPIPWLTARLTPPAKIRAMLPDMENPQ